VEEVPIDINIMRQFFWSEPKDTLAQKAVFDSKGFLQSYKSSLVCKLKNYGQPNASMFANGPLYWSTVYNNMSAYNNWIINTAFFYFSYLPESVIMLVYSVFSVFLWTVLYFFNICLSIIFHITAIPQLLRNADSKNANEWQAASDISFFNWKTLFLFFWLIPILLSFILLPIISTVSGIISPLCATYHYEGSADKQNILNFIIDTFVYKKFMFMILATLSLISNGITNLGSSSIISIVVAIVVLYFLGFYSNTLPNAGENGFVSGLRHPFTQLKADAIYTTNSKGEQIPKEIEICPPSSKITTNKLTTGLNTPSPVTHTVTNALAELKAKETNVNITPITQVPVTPITQVPVTPVVIPTANTSAVTPIAPAPVTPITPVTAVAPEPVAPITPITPIAPAPVTPVAPAPVNNAEAQPQKGGSNGKKPRVKKYSVKIM
jgi:hypothetical protein